MFALTNVDDFEGINLKVDPEEGAQLRDRFGFIQPAYHMNKRHWITVQMQEAVADLLVKRLIDNSYRLVVSGLTKSQKVALGTI